MRILFAGTPEISLPSLRELAQAHDLVAVLSAPDRPVGRGRQLRPSPVVQLAGELGIPTLRLEKLDSEARNTVAGLGCQLLVCVAYGKIFGPKFLGLFPNGGVNMHPSLLPRHRGPSPIAAAIRAGDRLTGITIQTLAQEMDAGDILLQEEIPLEGTETTASLTEHVAVRGATLLRVAVSAIEAGRAEPRPQDHTQASYCGLIQKQDGLLDWSASAVELDRIVRACRPWPGAFTFLSGQELKIHEARPLGLQADGTPGMVCAVDSSQGILVQTGDGVLALRRLQLPGRKALDWAPFLNGTPNLIGSVLGGTTK